MLSDRLAMNPDFTNILGTVIAALLLLAGVAAIILVFKAIDATSNEIHGASTLWGIFIVGLILAIATSGSPSILFPTIIFLIGLALVAAGTLLFKAATAKSKEIPGKSILWGIFIVRLLVGIGLIAKTGLWR